MQINWFTVIAQIINFMVLVWLMKRYLYKPVLKAVDDREKKIKEQLEAAEIREAEAIKEKEDFISKNKIFNQKKNEMLNAATIEANDERQKMMDVARQEASDLKEKLQQSILESQKNMNKAFEKKIRDGVFAIAGKTLSDLASGTLEKEIITFFLTKLTTIHEEDLLNLKEELKSNSSAILVQTAFTIDNEQKKEISNVVKELFSDNLSINYIENPDLIGGIELSCGGFKLSWSIKEYISTLQKETETLLKGNVETANN